ncbi:MAG TPA: penicillin acylase family protein [Candidatus Limnocylindria bacterium]|nr:penicillin acylase family protein [Candidatus Limnocylindria bacterium]
MIRRLALSSALVLVLTVVVAVLILFYRPHPAIDGDIRLLGMHERGEIVRDRYGVPRIFARNAHDLFYMQGYVLAQDRLFQMDLYRRAAHGRLSEVLGEVTLPADKLMRTLTLARAAERDVALMSPEARAAADAFAEGVNKFLEQHGESLPFEFLLLGYKPEPWTAVDSAAIVKLQTWDQAVNLQTELVRMAAAARLGPAALSALFPSADGATRDDAPAWRAIGGFVGAGAGVVGVDALRALVGDGTGGAGSNCWAVAPRKSASGRALFAGDPHLGIRNPSIWYEVGLEGAGYKVVGFTIPGVPGVILGHNERVAWSLTVAYVDQQDLYLEQPDPREPGRFMFRGASEPALVTRHQIRVRGRADTVPLDVVATRHGPIVTPVLKGQIASFALRWTALDGGRNLDAILALDRSRDWDSFRAALGMLEGPALVLCYADADGHVGWSLAGRMPLRAGADDGRLPLPGWDGAHEWQGSLDPRELPFAFDPPDGFAMSANHLQFPYRWNAGSRDEWDGGFRAARVVETLRAAERVSAESSRVLQTDVASVPARRLREALSAAQPSSALASAAQRIARDWDGVLGADSAGAAVYEAWLLRMVERTFKDRLGDAVYGEWVSHGRPFVALHRLAERPDDPWFTDLGSGARGRDAIAALALEDAAKDLASRLGGDPSKWRWGALHRITFAHPLGSVLPFLNVGPFDRPGDDDTPNDAPYDLLAPYAMKNHTSLRTIVDFADVEGALSVLPLGQSGLPLSGHWGDQTRLWLEGRLKPMPLSRERVADPEGRLVLRAH